MDSIIPLIIMLIVGALLSGKKKKSSQQEEAKPFTAQQESPDGPVKKLKEMYQEIQQEMQQQTQQQEPPRQMSVPAPRVVVELPPKPIEVAAPSKRGSKVRSRTRQSTRGKSTKVVEKQKSKIQVESILPKTKDDLIKGIIFSEIYGPPKSKR